MAASGWRSAIAVLGMSGVIALLAARPAAAVEMISTGGDWLAPVGLAAPAALTDAEMSSLFMDGGRIRSGRKDYWLSFGVQEFFSDLSGFVAFKNTGSASPFTAITGDRVDFVNDLGIKPRNNLTMPEVSFNFWGTQTLRVSYFALAQNATNTITRSFVFGGTTYTASDVVNTRFDLQMLRVRYEWGLLHFAPFSLAMGVGGDVIFVRAKIADQTSGEAADTGHQIGGTPIVSLRARFNLPAGFGIEAHAEGMYVGLGWLGRGEAGLDWQFLRYLSVQGGYRAEYVSVNMQDINGVSAGMRMQGAYVSATAWF